MLLTFHGVTQRITFFKKLARRNAGTGLHPPLLPLRAATRLKLIVGLRFKKMLFEMRGRFL